MKRILILLLIPWASAAHAVNCDSLWAIWNNKSLHDTVRLNAIYDLAWSYWETNPDSALILVKKEIELAVSGNYKIWQAFGYSIRGKALMQKENYAEAIHAFSVSLKIAREIGKTTLMGYNYRNLGIVFSHQEIYPKAIENYFAALKIYEELKNKDIQADLYHNISLIYSKINKDSLALEYVLKALALRDTNNRRGLAHNYAFAGALYDNLGAAKKGLQYMDKAKKIYEELGDMKGIATHYNNLGVMYKEKGDYQNAMASYLESVKISEKIQDKRKLALVSGNISSLQVILKNFNEAIRWGEKGLRLSRETGSLIIQKLASEGLYGAYKGLGENAKALEYYELTVKLDSSLRKEETASKLQQMEFQKQMLADSLKQEEEKLKVDMTHREQMHRQRNQKIILFSAIAVVLVMSFGIWRRLRYTRKAKAEIEKAKGVIEKEKERSENLLLNILPSEVAEEIKQDGHSRARTFSMVTVMFTDFKDFTAVSEKYSAELLVAEIDYCFSAFDNIIQKYGVEKIKTVGDAYMCVGGMPVLTTTHAFDVVSAAIEIRNFMLERKNEQDAKGGISFELRLGIHTGPVVAGIVGVKKYAYDIWGDTVNIAARMEQNSEAGKINISGSTYKLVKDKFNCVYRGKIEAKNKGEVEMYFVEGNQM